MKLKLTRLLVLLTTISFSSSMSNAQTVNTFTPYGKPLVLVYTDLNSSFSKNGSSKGFELTRAYLGYEYFFSNTFSSRINLDVANPEAGKLQMTAFIKNAYLLYKKDGFSARIGMIGVDQYNIQEKQWGYRYIYKSFQDAYNFGPSADLGAALEYSPVSFLTLNLSVLNGEGYKKLQADSTFKTSIGLSVKPVKGLELRGYYDIMKNDFAQTSIALYAGYFFKTFKAGVEYNIQQNNGMLNSHDFSGVSAYSSIILAGKYSIFTRYDYLRSATIDEATGPWNKSKDGQLFMTGLDYSPLAGVKIGATYKGWKPFDKAMYYTSTVSLNIEIKF